MEKNLKLSLLVLLLFTTVKMSAQIYGGDYAIEMPVRSIYDENMMLMSLDAERRFIESYNDKVGDYLLDAEDDIRTNYDERNYSKVISIVNEVFQSVTFYDFMNSDLSWLLRMRGLSFMNLGNYDYALKDLKKAKRKGDRIAGQYIKTIKKRRKGH